MSRPFIGSAICTVDKSGHLLLTADYCISITSRGSKGCLYVEMQEFIRCLVVFDAVLLHERIDHPCDRAADRSERSDALRRNIGFAAPAELDGKGRIAIPPWLNQRRGEAYQVLIVGMGHSFEVWDLEAALTDERADLRLLTALHLDLTTARTTKKDRHESSLQPFGSHHRVDLAEEPGLPFQPVYQMQPRHDPVGDRRPR